jgi:pyruvate dehydrogenase E2 component (dihydrolipoamide acetyltransferase)
MPSLGAEMARGRLVEWRVRPGSRVQRGDIIAEVETDKGVIDVEVFASGVVERILIEPGNTVEVGTPLAVIREEEAVTGVEGPTERLSPAAAPLPGAPSPGLPGPSIPPGHAAPLPEGTLARPTVAAGAPRVSPLARRRARELGIDAGILRGSGPDGAVTVADVERAAAVPAGPAAGATLEPPAVRMRRVIGAAMLRSKREIPHFYLSTAIDMGSALSWLAAANAARDVSRRLLPGALLLKAVALSLREVPELNARWEEGAVRQLADIHLGVAISLRGGGLVAPAIHHADRLDLDALMAAVKDLVERARAGRLRSSELSDGTITVTSLGDRGVDTVIPIIFPPQAAMVGFGRVVKRPWVVEGSVVARPVVHASLAADHRVSDGHRAARFLAGVEARLRQPESL